MRHGLLCVFLSASLPAFAAAAVAAEIEWVFVGEPGNPPDTLTHCFENDCGSVAVPYRIGRYEVTNDQYAEFLNAVADADPNGLYNVAMGSDARGGIVRTGGSGSYSYAVKSGRGSNPVVFVSFYDALRFANWLQNGKPAGAQSAGTTEDGAYTITPGGVAGNSIVRNPGALYFLPSENEWYKAAFYDRAVGIYYDYPTGTNATPVSGPPPGSDNTANYWNGTYALTGTGAFDDGFNYLTNVGAYASAESPYGTFDQAGNVWEWNEVANDVTQRGRRGGGWDDNNAYLAASLPVDDDPMTESYDVGFRVAAAPEPEPVLLAAVGALTLAGLRRGHRDRRASARAGALRR